MLTKQEIIDLINSLLPDNENNLISAEDLRTVLESMNDSELNLIDDNSLLGLSEFDPSKSYKSGQAVVFEGDIYQANTNVSPSSWNSDFFDKISTYIPDFNFDDYAKKTNVIELDDTKKIKALSNNENFTTITESNIFLVNNTDGNFGVNEIYPKNGKAILEILKRTSSNETLYRYSPIQSLNTFFVKKQSDATWTEFKASQNNETTASNGLTMVGTTDVQDGGEFNVIEKSGNFYTLTANWIITQNSLVNAINTGQFTVTSPTFTLGLNSDLNATISGDSTTINMLSENLNINAQTINSTGLINHGGTIQYTGEVYSDSISDLQVPYWKKIVDFVSDATGGLPSVANGLKIEDNAIKLGGELTDDNTRLTVNSPNKNLFIGAPVNGQDLGFISLSSTVFNINNAVDHDTAQGNTLYITPGGLNSINQFQSGVQTVLNANPEAVVMRYGDNKLINLYIFGGGIIPAGGETLTINDITFTEGIDFIGEGNYVLDTTNILNTLNWNSIPNFVSVTQKTDSFNEPYLEVIFSEIAVATTTISNLSISNFANENKMLVDKDVVLLKSRNNEITLTNDITSINAKNFNIVQNNEEGVIKNTLYLNAFGSFLSNRDATDSSISSSSISGGFGSNISNFNNKKIGLQISGEILSGESFTVNGITFTEGVDFTAVNDPNLDALAIANIDYSSVPNFVSVSSVNDFITFIFNTIDNTIVSNITNSYVANYLFTTSVFAGKDFALIQSNNSGLQIGDTGHIFSDNTIEKQGIRYAGDYSATYTDRSLIDKAYADSLNTNAVDKDTVKLAENINKGQAVYVSGANGTNIIVSKASNTSEATSSKTFGLLETSGVTNDIVNVVTRGLLTGLDTSASTVGDAVWLGTNGDLLYGLANKPYAPAHLVFIGVVTRHHAVNGEIFVNVQNGFELNEIHNVSITTPTDNQALIYESASGLWKNKDITAVGTITSGTWNGSVIDSAYLPSYVDDVLEYANLASLPITGDSGKIYVTLDTNKIYRWSGSVYVEISSSTIPNLQAVTDVGSTTSVKNITVANYISFGRGGGADIAGNLAIGESGTLSVATGGGNTAIGYRVLNANTTGSENTGLGVYSLSFNTTGSNNMGIGRSALYLNSTGSSNTAVGGYQTLINNSSGSYNTGIGQEALRGNTTGSNNTGIGYLSNVSTGNLTNAMALGANATVTASNTIQLGNSSITNTKTSGTLTLGTITYPNTDGTSGQVLTTNGSGSLSWTTVSGGSTYSAGSGLTLTGTVFSISSGAITDAMLAGSIDLTTKVTGILPSNLGGTGVANNPAFTITLGGAITTSNNVIIGSSNHTVSLTTTGNTNITLPTTGTLSTLAGTETLTNKTLTTPNIASIKGTLTSNTDGATITFNKNTSDFHNVTLGGNRTLALSNMAVGDRIVIRLTQDATGSRTVTWFSTIKWAGGVAPTLTTTANKADVFGFLCTGTNAYDGFVIGQNI